jgi:hypothetical protein
MPRFDVWSHASGTTLQDLLRSSLASLLLAGPENRPAYFSSPWMSDFPLFPNRFCEFAGLIPEHADAGEMLFSQYLAQLSVQRPVRVIMVRNPTSTAFAARLAHERGRDLAIGYVPESYHEKGLLTPLFYLEGSMNLTYSGVYVRDEKVSFHAGPEPAEIRVIERAYLEFDRRWEFRVN